MKTKKNKKEPGILDWYEIPMLVILTIIGAGLRLYNLGVSSLWLDEAATITLSQGGFWNIWLNTVKGEFNPPFFNWLTYVMMSLFGNSEVVIRFLPALFGIAAIPVFYLIGKEFKDKHTGIIMAAACTFSPFLVWYSQEARAYSLLLLLVGIATYFFLRGLRTDDLKDWSAFAIIGALAFWTHFYALVIIGALFFYALVFYVIKRNLKPVLVSLCIWMFLSLPLLNELGQLFAKRTLTAPTYGIQGLAIIYETYKDFSGFADLVLVIFLILFVIGMFRTYGYDSRKAVLLVFVFCLTLIFSVIASTIIPMLPRYLIFLTIFFYLEIAMSYESLLAIFPKPYEAAYVAIWIIAFFGVLFVPYATTYYNGNQKDDWRGTALYLDNITQSGDVVVLVPNYNALPFDYYYHNHPMTVIEASANSVVQLDQIKQEYDLENKSVYYVVTSDITAVDPSGASWQWLNQNATVIQELRNGIYVMRGAIL